jgi:hypothetical protein
MPFHGWSQSLQVDLSSGYLQRFGEVNAVVANQALIFTMPLDTLLTMLGKKE